jgi:hypothetical protein
MVALLGLPPRCKESGFCLRKTGSFHADSSGDDLGRRVVVDLISSGDNSGNNSSDDSGNNSGDDSCETWVPLGPHRPGSRLCPTSGSGLPEDSPTCQWAQPT